MIGGKNQGLQTQRRDRLDGGLNTRRSPFLLDEGQAFAIQNIGFQEEGSLRTRKFAQLLRQSTWFGSGLAPAPVLTQIVGGGTLAAGDYEVQYLLSVEPHGISRFSNPSATSAVITVGANDRIQIDILPNNLGEGQGQAADGGDDPFNGGTKGPLIAAATMIVQVKKSTDPTFTQQSITFTWNTAARVQRAVLASYSTAAGTVPSQEGQFPLRFLFWNPATQAAIGITVDKAVQFAGDFSAFTRFGIANDKAGNPHYWSRHPARMFAAYLDQFPVISDNFSRPKRLHWTGTIATSNWRLIGANPPATAPTTALNAIAGNLNGVYFYKVAFVYRNARGDLTTADIESNGSPLSAASVNVPNQRLDVTIPGTPETGLQFRRVYRTRGGGTVLFFHSDQAAGSGNLTFTDNTADASLGITTPADDLGKIANDVPPQKLAYLCSHRQRCFAFESNYLVDSSNRIIDYIATNFLRFTKASSFGSSENIDAWPGEFRIECGDATPPTGLVSHRGVLYWFKGNEIGQLTGSDETDFTPDTVLAGVGSMRNAILSVGSLIYFWEDARAAMVFDGSSFQQIAYDIQPTWDVDRDAGYYPIAVWFDPNRQEIHWTMTTWGFAPGSDNTSALFKEYVFYVPTKAWTIYSGKGSGTIPSRRSVGAAARVVMAADIARQVYTQALGTFNGVAAKEAVLGLPTDDADALDTGTAVVDVKLFFGESWETVKTLDSLMVYSVIGASAGSIAISVRVAGIGASGSEVYVPLATLTATSSKPSERVDRVKIPQELVEQVVGSGAKLSQGRALMVRLTIVPSDSIIIRGVSLKYKEQSDLRDFP